MPAAPCMYRRPSGVFVVRLAVPQRLRQQVGRRELHASTGLGDWPLAKIAATRILIELRQRLMPPVLHCSQDPQHLHQGHQLAAR